MYPNNFLTPMVEQSGTFTVPVNTDDTVLTPLEPFSTDANGDFYNSATALGLSTFGYTYPEIQDWDQTVQQLQENVTAQVNTMWGASSSLSKRGLAPGSQVIEWSVGISVSRAELNGLSFNIRIFLEHVPESPLEWPTSDNYVNSFIILSSPSVSSALSYNDIDLSNGLRAKGYDGQDVPTTVSYLKEHLHWRVQLVSRFKLIMFDGNRHMLIIHRLMARLYPQANSLH
jgi:tyrosinase